MNTPFTLALFSPGEAEKITGLSTTMQRDWRHRGFLPKNDGHARFDLFTLAMMMVLKLFADRNFGPQAVKTIADITARAIAWHALEFVDSFEGDIPDYPDSARRALWNSLGFPRLVPPASSSSSPTNPSGGIIPSTTPSLRTTAPRSVRGRSSSST